MRRGEWLLFRSELLGLDAISDMGSFLITQTLNTPDPNGDGSFVRQANGPSLSISGSSVSEPIYDSSADINGVFAKWAAVPDCSPFPRRGSSRRLFP